MRVRHSHLNQENIKIMEIFMHVWIGLFAFLLGTLVKQDVDEYRKDKK